ncbi:MAG: ferrous iron transport protein B [Deltaproteobacteria bacterium]|nr:ferrous iron transport protein B [Deltaproteobacteria bacterium]
MHTHSNVHKEEVGRKVVLVGNPNVGKSVIFGSLTGRYADVSNYPGTTVEVSRGKVLIGGEAILIVDSPGVNSLVPMSEDERVTRDILLNDCVDSIIHVADSKNLRRALLVAVQLSEMGLPLVLALNMYDEAGERGIRIDRPALASVLGIEVVPTIATQGWGIDELKEGILNARRARLRVEYPHAIEEAIGKIEAILPQVNTMKRSLAVMILSGDRTLSDWLKERLSEDALDRIARIKQDLDSRSHEPVGYIINRVRLRSVDDIIKRTVTKEEAEVGRFRVFLGHVSMHPVWGVPLLFLVLFLMYEFVGVLGAGVFVDFIENTVFGSYLNPWAERVVSLGFPSGFVYDILVGQYGIVTMALTYAIAIVLPIVCAFFVFFGLLEDSGYLPRLAVMVDRVFKMMGLNGKAVLPMVLGLGCDTMATMTTRILETKKERVIVTLLLALGVPCSAQLGVILGMLGAVSFKATLVWASVVLLVIFVVGYLSSKVLPGARSDFMIEIPPLRVPQASNIALKTLVRVEWYLKEALPLFVFGTLLLFTLDRIDALSALEVMVSPVVVGFLGLPADTTAAFIVGFLRRDYGAAGLLALQTKGLLDPVQVVVSLVTITLFIPCIANLFMIIKERGIKTALWMTLFIFPFAFLVGGVLNMILRGLDVRL